MISFAELVSGKKSRTAVPPTLSGSGRADRVAKLASARQGTKQTSAAAGEVRQARPGTPSKYAHLAAACAAGAAEIAAQAKRSQTFDDIPSGHGMRAAAIRNAIIANAGRIPGATSPEDVAAFAVAAVAKSRGRKPAALAKSRPPIKADLSTPQGVAAFVAASAAKARGQKK